VTVDGISYEYLGAGSQALPTLPNLRTAVPLTVSYDAQYSNFTFVAGPVELTASFLSTVLPTDLCRTSIPLSYLVVTATAIDNQTHDIQLYNDINGAWAAYESNATLTWKMYEDGVSVNSTNVTNSDSALYSWFVALEQPYEFGEESDRNLWGNFTFTTSQGCARNVSFESGFSTDLRFKYLGYQSLSNIEDSLYRGFGSRNPVFAYAHDFGRVRSASATYTLGSVQEPAVRYVHCGKHLRLC